MKPTLTFIVNQGAGTGRTARLWGKVKQILDEHDILYEASASGIPKWKTFLCLPFLVAAKHERIRGFAVTDVECLFPRAYGLVFVDVVKNFAVTKLLPVIIILVA